MQKKIMERERLDSFALIGIGLPFKTSNAGGRSASDCGYLWRLFNEGNYLKKIKDRTSDDIYAVYFNYESDFQGSFSYFIGCKVGIGQKVPGGLQKLLVPEGEYAKIVAKGKIPDCVASAWRTIWNEDLARAYEIDFEVYSDKSADQENAVIDVFVSVL